MIIREILILFPDSSDPEVTNTSGDGGVFDFISNGAKMRDDATNTNVSGDTFLYIAFAEAPFKTSNAR